MTWGANIILGLVALGVLALALKRLDDMIAQDRAVYRRLGLRG